MSGHGAKTPKTTHAKAELQMFGQMLSNVPLGTANVLAYAMLVVVAVYLISAASSTYYYYRKNKKTKAAPVTGSV